MCLCPALVTGGTRALGKVLFRDCQSGKCQKQHLRLVSHSFSFLIPVPWTHPSFCNATLGRVLSSIGGVTLSKEVGGGNPSTRRHGTHGAFQSSSSSEPPHPFSSVGVVSLQEDLLGSGGCGPV